MKSEFEPHPQNTQSLELEMSPVFNILNDLESDPFADDQTEKAIGFTVSTNYCSPEALVHTENAMYQPSSKYITPTTPRRNGYTAFYNMALLGISISVIIHTI